MDNLQNRVSTVTSSGALGDLVVGNTQPGRMDVMARGIVMNHRGYIGLNTGVEGSVYVSGSASSWRNNGSTWGGNSRSGTLEVLDGASVSSAGNGYLAFSGNTSGYALVSGPGSTWTTARPPSSGRHIMISAASAARDRIATGIALMEVFPLN